MLIDIWSQHENMFNTKNKNYFNRDIRQKTLVTMERTLNENGLVATVKQIGKKITDLKNYYGAQRRMTENSKASGAGTDEVYTSSWKFFGHLHFLSDAFTPRRTKSNAEITDDTSPYDVTKPPSAKSTRKTVVSQNEDLHKVMNSAAAALESIASKKLVNRENEEDSDNSFCNLLKSQLTQIPECDTKDDLRINIQQMVLTCKRQINRPINHIALLQTPTGGYSPSNFSSHAPFNSPNSSSSSHSYRNLGSPPSFTGSPAS